MVGNRKQSIFEIDKVVLMRVPAFAPFSTDGSRKVNRDKSYAGLDEPSGQQTGLAIGRSAIGIAKLARLFGKIESRLQFGRRENRKRLLLKLIDASSFGKLLFQLNLIVDDLQEVPSRFQARKVDRRWQLQFW